MYTLYLFWTLEKMKHLQANQNSSPGKWRNPQTPRTETELQSVDSGRQATLLRYGLHFQSISRKQHSLGFIKLYWPPKIKLLLICRVASAIVFHRVVGHHMGSYSLKISIGCADLIFISEHESIAHDSGCLTSKRILIMSRLLSDHRGGRMGYSMYNWL